MSTQILYNNFDPFSGIAGTPLVSLNEQFIKYGEQWGLKNTITLNGTITGGCQYFSDLISGQNSLVRSFGKDFQSLQIVENGQVIFNKPTCIIRGINFADSNYVKLLPFTIEIDCYESGFFSGTYGVLEPHNEFNFIQEKDQSVRIEHTISCRGFNTDSNNSNALQNARNYVNQFSGFKNQISPYFIQLCSGYQPSLVAAQENIDRVVGSYGISESYILERDNPSGVLRFTCDYSSGISDGISNLSINGTVKTAKNQSINVLRGRYLAFDSFSEAVNAYSGCTNRIDLNPYYLTSGVSEDPFARSLSFNIAFNNDVISSPFLDYSVNFTKDNLSDVTSVQFQGTIKGRGELSQKWNQVQAYASGVNPFLIANSEYLNDGYSYTLNPIPISTSTTKNPFVGEISLAATYSDKSLPISGLASLDYSISVTPSIRKYSAVPLLNGLSNYYITDMNYTNREIVFIQGAAVTDSSIPNQSGIAILNGFINGLGFTYCTGTRINLEEQSIIQGNKSIGRNVSFSATWGSETPELVI